MCTLKMFMKVQAVIMKISYENYAVEENSVRIESIQPKHLTKTKNSLFSKKHRSMNEK